MKAEVAGATADQRLLDILATLLRQGALPGELDDYSAEETREAAAFIAACAGKRQPGHALVRLESTGTGLGQRRMRIGIVNDDMPFLVDSVAQAIAARGLIIHRLLHPVVCASRDEDGCLTEIEGLCEDRSRRESIIYIEVDRADAKGRQELQVELQRVLSDVRAAVTDWRAMQANMHAQADTVRDPEGRALLHWLADGAMTLLGYEVERPGEAPSHGLGIMGKPGQPTDEGGSEGAIRYFEEGGQEPLIAKADLRSPVHRRVPLDLIVVPLRERGKITGIGVHAGLWTSQALTVPIEEVPVLRRQLAELEKDFGFDPSGHSGKALRHALASLPRDLMVNLRAGEVKRLVATAISLADRPRPTLLLVRSILQGHMFAFVWLPRDELTTRRRVSIGEMIEQASNGSITNWSVDLGDGDLALVRYTLNVDAKTPTPDVAALDRKLDAMVRGWAPSVEEALGEVVGATRATRLALTYLHEIPEGYRIRTAAEDAARDIVCLSGLEGAGERDVRLFRRDSDTEDRLHLKTYRVGGIIPLSEAVPVFENFGFRVLDEVPTPVGRGGAVGYVHDFELQMPASGDAGQVLKRGAIVERAVADVLEGKGENDPFNQLIVSTGLEPREVTLFRAWFRYLRQTGLSYSQITVVDALRRAPEVTRGLIALFDAMHEPELKGERDAAVAAAQKKIDKGLESVAAIDEDRILRLIRGLIAATLRTNAFAPSGEEALAFKLDSAAVPGLPAPRPWREIWVYSPRLEGIHLRGGPIARGGLRWCDRRDVFRTEILGLMTAQLV
jgi:glutamate dehydrogenase